jgi:hypothetical protein
MHSLFLDSSLVSEPLLTLRSCVAGSAGRGNCWYSEHYLLPDDSAWGRLADVTIGFQQQEKGGHKVTWKVSLCFVTYNTSIDDIIDRDQNR